MGKITRILILALATLVLSMAGIDEAPAVIIDSGGEGCVSIGGLWDSGSLTCTLMEPVIVPGGIEIGSNGITLDGAGLTITGGGSGSGVYFYSKTGVTIKNLHIENFNFGIFAVYFNNYNNIADNTVSNNKCIGIVFNYDNNNNTILGNTVTNNGFGCLLDWVSPPSGIILWGSSDINTLSGNTISNNNRDGIILSGANNNIVAGNTISNNVLNGIWISSSSNNEVFNNNFIGNPEQALVSGIGNVFNKPEPTGGNYWDDYDTPAEECYDQDNDGFCDAPYTFLVNGQDNLPWTTPSGWEAAPPGFMLSPAAATNPVGTTHTVTITVSQTVGTTTSPVPNVTVSFTVIGANTASGSCATDANGQCTFTYTGTSAGADTITASAIFATRAQLTTASKTWQAPTAFGCPKTQGFWKNHLEAWPVTSLTLGSVSYTQAQLLTILNTPVRGDASLILVRQLIAAKLNIANGSDPTPVASTIAVADGLLGATPVPQNIRSSSLTGQAMVSAASVLDSYNNGQLTPTCTP